MSGNHWDPLSYRTQYRFVTAYGDDVLSQLQVQPGWRVLDLGCGTGEHAAEIAARGADVVGVDASPAMLDEARRLHPTVEFVVVDATLDDPSTIGVFDAAFSNAALHWMRPQQAALNYVRGALRRGGQFIAEMGGAGNVARVDEALRSACAAAGLGAEPVDVNWFPTVAQESSLLEAAGFRVEEMRWFERPVVLGDGITPAQWSQDFRTHAWAQVPKSLVADVESRMNIEAKRLGLHGPDGWIVDFARLRFTATAC